MRSSGNTPNRRSLSAVRLLVLLTGEDHPKACTGRRLLRWGRVRPFSSADSHSADPVVLDPYAPTPLSRADAETAQRGGLLVVDCSWNRLSARGSFPAQDGPLRLGRIHRRLPVLVAANPQHYGRITQLTTAEAFCGALAVLGRPAEATRVIAGFAGGNEFLEINRTRLDRYLQALGPDEILAAERELFGGP